jgi:hypothetical protein
MGIFESASRITRKPAEKIKENCNISMRMMANEITQIKAPIVEKLEKMLTQWIEHQHQRAIPLSTVIIQTKVKSLFENLNAIEPDLKGHLFAASSGWFECSKEHHGFYNLNLTGSCSS